MKKVHLLFVLCVLGLMTANAQFRKKPGGGGGGTTTTPATQQGGAGNKQTAPAAAPAKPLTEVKPVVVDKTKDASSNPLPGLNRSTSLRNNAAIEKNLVKERTPLEYEHLREDDAIFSHFVWREINAKEKLNQPFLYQAKDENGIQSFFYILLNAIKEDSVTAFSADFQDDRFTTPISIDSLLNSMKGKRTYSLQPNLDDPNINDTIYYFDTKLAPKVDSIYTFRIKEQWIFDKESSRMFVRILGVAPVAMITPPGAQKSEPQTLFWIYYPDLRKTLAKTEVYNGKNMAQRMTWEDLFEARMFSSYIVKSTIDNPNDFFLKEFPGLKDSKLFQLYEGENIKEKIFNYEQSLWSY